MSKKRKTSKSVTPNDMDRAFPSVRIRMYRQGLGDCFLITFNPGPQQASILIDFGTLGSSQKRASMEDVISNIESETKDGSGKSHLNLIIATHEHQDHLNGFRTFKERFKKFSVDNVWLAWTEDKSDPLTQKLGKTEDVALALASTAKALLAQKGIDDSAHDVGQSLLGLLTFTGDFGAAGFAPTVNDAMSFVRDSFVTARFLKPGDAPLEEAWLPGFRFYVLGPPRSEEAIKDLGGKDDPRLDGLQGLAAAAALHLNEITDVQACEREMPFDLRFRRAEVDPVLAPVIGSYLADESKWRRIDNDWLFNAAEFALQFDTFINNTSLALAIERIADRKVLLFPGDAQAGSWTSWQSLKWTVKEPDGLTQEVTARDLLSRTVFYKAGHHASHNGTAKGAGLEQMINNDDLVTFIPVDRSKALNQTSPWKMPAQDLYSRLLEASNGRVVRSDIGWAVDPSAQPGVEADLAPAGTAEFWQTWKANQKSATVDIHPKWIDFHLNDAAHTNSSQLPKSREQQTETEPGEVTLNLDGLSEPISLKDALAITDEWQVTNDRRIKLIERELAGDFTIAEREELQRLQKLAWAKRNMTMPLPTRELARIRAALERQLVSEK